MDLKFTQRIPCEIFPVKRTHSPKQWNVKAWIHSSVRGLEGMAETATVQCARGVRWEDRKRDVCRFLRSLRRLATFFFLLLQNLAAHLHSESHELRLMLRHLSSFRKFENTLSLQSPDGNWSVCWFSWRVGAAGFGIHATPPTLPFPSGYIDSQASQPHM